MFKCITLRWSVEKVKGITYYFSNEKHFLFQLKKSKKVLFSKQTLILYKYNLQARRYKMDAFINLSCHIK